jgi:hypothetical protein
MGSHRLDGVGNRRLDQPIEDLLDGADRLIQERCCLVVDRPVGRHSRMYILQIMTGDRLDRLRLLQPRVHLHDRLHDRRDDVQSGRQCLWIGGAEIEQHAAVAGDTMTNGSNSTTSRRITTNAATRMITSILLANRRRFWRYLRGAARRRNGVSG